MSRIAKIADKLWQGALAHVAEDGIPDEIEFVILMASMPGEIFVPEGCIFIHYIINDDANGAPATTIAKMKSIASIVADYNVLTICQMGENRSGLMSALILMARGYDGETACAIVQSRGPINSQVEHSFWNPGFSKQIKEMEILI